MNESPASAAEEEFQHRAYPGTDIPLAWTRKARATYMRVAAQEVRGAKPQPGVWAPIGPNEEPYPAILTFSGARYTASGRITALAIAPTCVKKNCRLWVGAAGGGIWQTADGLASKPVWTSSSSGLTSNAIGALVLDPTDNTGNTLYAGTGEPNASGDSESGLGVFKSVDGGQTWTPIGDNSHFLARSISSVVVDPSNAQNLWVATTRGVRGISSVTGGAASLAPGAGAWGLWKSTNGGASWTYVFNGAADTSESGCGTSASTVQCSQRGVNKVMLDPGHANTLYASAFGRGIWRSVDGGSSWTQIYTPISTTSDTRAEFAVAALGNTDTRMYVAEGSSGSPASRFFRSDVVQTGSPVFDLKTSSSTSSPYYATYNYCTVQCWYDNWVVSPPGHPDWVYIGGSFGYGEIPNGGSGISDGRAVLFSDTAGDPDASNNNRTFTDLTFDAGKKAPGALHPDQHAFVLNPNNPNQWFEGNDGGVMRSDGLYADASAQCAARGLGGNNLTTCQLLLSRVPHKLIPMNKGLATLQFQSLSTSVDGKVIQGGTQDNGTLGRRLSQQWPMIIYGDGGNSGVNAANSKLRVNTFTGQAHDANFNNGNPKSWVVIGGPIANSPEGAAFYPPLLPTPTRRWRDRSSRARRASGGRRTGAAIPPSSSRTAQSSRPRRRTRVAATS